MSELIKRLLWAELASANRECEVRNERELGYLARAQAAEAERDALRADAERYRWLRQWAGRSKEFPSDLSDPTNPEEMDATIDAAMRGKETGNG